MRTAIFLMASLLSGMAMANTTVFGLTIQETTETEFNTRHASAQHKASSTDQKNYKVYDIDGKSLGDKDVQQAKVVFDAEGKLSAVMSTLDPRGYNRRMSSLSKSHELVQETGRFAAKKSATFRNEDGVQVDISVNLGKSFMTMTVMDEAYTALMVPKSESKP